MTTDELALKFDESLMLTVAFPIWSIIDIISSYMK